MPARRSTPGAASICLKTDRKSTRLNSSHLVISYAVFCLKKKKQNAFSHYYELMPDTSKVEPLNTIRSDADDFYLATYATTTSAIDTVASRVADTTCLHTHEVCARASCLLPVDANAQPINYTS